jgi:hypothetical protein
MKLKEQNRIQRAQKDPLEEKKVGAWCCSLPLLLLPFRVSVKKHTVAFFFLLCVAFGERIVSLGETS